MSNWAGATASTDPATSTGLPRLSSFLAGSSPDYSQLPAPSGGGGRAPRPYAGVGKMPMNLFDLTPNAFGTGDPSVPKPAGIIPSLMGTAFGAVGGIFGPDVGKAAHDVGFTIGDVLDIPFDILTNAPPVPFLPGGLFSPQFIGEWNSMSEPERQDAMNKVNADPLNALSILPQAARAAYNKAADKGLVNPLHAPFVAPATSVGDQIANAFALLGLPAMGVQRTFAGATGRAGQIAGYKGTDPVLVNLRDRYLAGDFGQGAEASDRLLDQLTAQGRGFTDDALTNMGLSLVTDPIILLGGGVGLAGKAATTGERALFAGAMEINAADKLALAKSVGHFLSAFPTGERLGVAQQVVDRVAAAQKITDVEAIRLVGRNPVIGYRAMRQVADLPQYAAQKAEAMANLSYGQRFATSIEPTLRPVFNLIRRLNNPIDLFGADAAGKTAVGHLSDQLTEGWLRAHDLDKVKGVFDSLDAYPTLKANFTEGVGIYGHNLTRWFIRRRVTRDVRRLQGMAEGTTPEQYVVARLRGVEGKSVAAQVEMTARRVMRQYLPTRKGGAAEALARAQGEAASRLVHMDPSMDAQAAAEIASKFDLRQVALVDEAYFGWSVKTLRAARSAAIRAGSPSKVPLDRVTTIGPRELTQSRAEALAEALKAGDVAAVRRASQEYDLLFDHIGEGNLSDSDLMKAVNDAIFKPGTKDLRDDLVVDIVDPTTLPPELQQWLAENADLGYRLGLRPEDARLWRETPVFDENGNITRLSVNPWLETTDEAASVPEINQWKVMRDRLFGEIRGERIILEAKQRFADYTAENWGLTGEQANGLFSRLQQASNVEHVTPRGLTTERMYQIVMSHHLPKELTDQITEREAAEAFILAHEGRLRTVGVSQKFTGVLKTGFAGQGNWVGRVAERVYPTVRFALNPFFQMQEAVEPFILNVMRGVKPGFKPTEWDQKTLMLAHQMMRDGRYTFDDQIEFGDLLLWGEIATKDGMGASTPLGKALNVLTIGGRFNIKRMKEANYARLMRRNFGETFHEAVMRTSPALWDRLVAEAGTGDKGMIALRYMTEKSVWANSDPQAIRALAQAIKPSDLGRRTWVQLDDVARALRQIDNARFGAITNGAALKVAIHDGAITARDVKRTLRDFGADADYANRAATVASMHFSVDEWFDAYRDTLGLGSKITTTQMRRLFQALADAQGSSLEEWMARHFHDVPMSADAADFASLADNELGALRLQAIAEKARELDEVPFLREFRAKTRGMNVEHALAYDAATGKVLLDKPGVPLGVEKGPGVTGMVRLTKSDMQRLRGSIFFHNHPWVPGEGGLAGDLSFSVGDINTATIAKVAEIRAESPGFSYSLRPGPGGWPPDFYDAGFIRREVHRYLADWEVNVRPGHPEVPSMGAYGDKAVTPDQWAIHRSAQDYAIRRLAEEHGLEYHSTFDPYLSNDQWESEIRAVMDNPPAWITQSGRPTHALSSPLETFDRQLSRPVAPTATNIAFEVQPGRVTPNEATFGSLMDIPDPKARMAITAGMEEHFRGIVEDALGVKIARALPGVGGWQPETGAFTLTPNAVWTMADTTSREDTLATMQMIGYLGQQDAVYASLVKPGLEIADPMRDEHWALTVVLPRRLTPEEIGTVTTKMHEVAPGIAGWGSHAVETADGRTGIRFIRFTDDNYARESFLERLNVEGGAGWEQRLFDSLGPEYDGVETNADVVEALAAENDWTVNPNGEGYLQTLWDAGHEDVADRLVTEWGPSAERRLAGLYQQHAPVEWGKRLASGAGDAAELDYAAAHAPPAGARALTDQYRLLIPGGEGRPGPFTLMEQMALKGQNIPVGRLWQADPLLVIRGLYKPTWRSKVKDPTDPLNVYNSMVFAGLSPRSNLTINEATYSRLRALIRPGETREEALNRQVYIADTYRAHVPEALQDTQEGASEVARMFQLEQGNYRSVADPQGFATAGVRKPEAAVALAERGEEIAQQHIAEGMAPYEAYRLATKEVAKDAARQRFVLLGRSWGSDISGFHSPLGNWMVGTRTGMRGVATNVQWGHGLQWASQLLAEPKLRGWMVRQSGETTVQHAFRLASVVRGLDAKTALLAMDMMGPATTRMAIIDTVMAREIARDAIRRGKIDDLLGSLSPTYRRDMEDSIAALGLGTRGGRRVLGDRVEFESPTTGKASLLSGARAKMQADPVAALAAMRRRLNEVITDPEERALYDDDILRLIALNNDGSILREGGDYAVMDAYVGGMKTREAEALRTQATRLGEVEASRWREAADELDRMSNAEYQWLRWDRSRGPYEPHAVMSDGIESLPRMPDLLVRDSVTALRGAGFMDLNPTHQLRVDPRMALVLQKIDQKVLGATATMNDGTRIIMATQHADARTGLHELAHVFFPDLDPSAKRAIVTAYNAATGSKGRAMTVEAEEWFSDQFTAFLAAGAAPTRELRPTFLNFRKWLGAIYRSIKQDEESAAFKAARTTALKDARTALATAKSATRKAQGVAYRARRTADTATDVLRREKARYTADFLSLREANWIEREQQAIEVLKERQGALRGAEEELAYAKSRLAAGNPSQRGGFTRALPAYENKRAVAETGVRAAQKDVDAFHLQAVKAGQAARAARRRTSIAKYQKTHDEAKAALHTANDTLAQAETAQKRAQRAVEDALRSREPRVARAAPTVSPAMEQVFKDALKPVDPVVVPRRYKFDAAAFNPEEEAVYNAAEEALLKAEDDAFTTHYYKRGRNWFERSINHQYFGLYPFSYMWGKMLPLMIRFLVKDPFGVPAPFAGLEASQSVYRAIMLQKDSDPTFRAWLQKNDGAFQFASMLMPALPWTIPVNAPLWVRRITETESINAQRQQQGKKPIPLGFRQVGTIASDTATYAFGPAYVFQTLGEAGGMLTDLGTSLSESLQDTVDSVFSPPPVTAPGAFR